MWEVTKSDFGRVHPIFGEQRDAATYSGTLVLTWLNPLGYQGFLNNWLLAAGCSNSKIEFFDRCTRILGASIGYRF